MRTRGRTKWIPPNLLDEVISVKKEEAIYNDADAMKKVAEYSKVGREVKRIRDRFFLQDIMGKKQ